MWCDPSITLDLNFLPLIQSLDETAMCEYPIEGKELRRLMNKAVGEFNLNAATGATYLLFLKSEVAHLKKDFPIVHLSFLDRIFYLIGEASMSNQVQNAMLKFTSQAISKWFSEATKEELEKVLLNLKAELNIFEKSMQFVEDIGDKKFLTTKMLLLFDNMLKSEKTKEEPFTKKFEDHGNFIHKNQKSLYLLVMAYEIEYLLVSHINKDVEMYSPDHLIAFIENKLNNITAIRRFSVLIQNVACILRKLLIIKVKHPIPQEVYFIFLLKIEEIIDRFFTRVKLTQNINHFSFHMRYNNFFDYLLNVFNPKVEKQYQLIDTWKKKLSEYILESSPKDSRQIQSTSIEEGIFFLQLRNKYDSLRCSDMSNQINEFPSIDQNVILRAISHNQLKQKGISLATKIVQILQKGQGKQYYESLNMLEKGIVFYYLHYYQGYSFIQKKKTNKLATNSNIITTFMHNLTNNQLLQLIQFYLLDVQLGNFYNVSLGGDYANENSINGLIYETLIDLLYLRLFNSLSEYKKLESTKDLLHLKTMHKYLIFLIKAICPQYEVPFLCKGCKQISDGVICLECEYICLGVQLHSSKNPFNMCRDKYIYQQMICKLRDKCKQALHQMRIEMEVCSMEWLYMLSSVLESMIPY